MPKIDILAPDSLSGALVEIIEAAPLPGLGSGPQCAETSGRIKNLLSVDDKLKGTPSEAGLWLLAGELDESHRVSQADASATGSYWHGIMHRREGDFWNAKYWFRKVHRHQVCEQLAQLIADRLVDFVATSKQSSLILPDQLPTALVDTVERATANHTAWTPDVQQITWWEWQLLFASCAVQ
ncbi:MAG: hypothetical protein R3C53_04785 [Pirellulaceae bacterium]